MRKIIFLISILIIGLKINAQELTVSSKKQYSNTELKQNFTDKEIEDLFKITEFFKNQICEDSNSDFKSCFIKILPDLVANGSGPILDNVDFEKQKKLYNSISTSTFGEIWEFGKVTYRDTGLELKSLYPKYNGKYLKYLIQLGKNNSKIKEYADRIIASGDFEAMGILQHRIYLYPSEFDLDNPNIQLIVSIHFLTQNDQQKRTDEW